MNLSEKIKSLEVRLFGDNRFKTLKGYIDSDQLTKLTLNDCQYLEKYHYKYFKELQKSVKVCFVEEDEPT